MTSISGLSSKSNAAWFAAREKNNNHIINHENLHLAAAGQYANGGIHIDYNSDGWAVSGHVNVSMPATPTEKQSKVSLGKTIAHANAVAKSAMAPSDPSEQDYKVYSQVQQILFQANQLLNKKKDEPTQEEQDAKATGNLEPKVATKNTKA